MFLIANVVAPGSDQTLGALYTGGALGFIVKSGMFDDASIDFVDRLTGDYETVEAAAGALSSALGQPVYFNSMDRILDWFG